MKRINVFLIMAVLSLASFSPYIFAADTQDIEGAYLRGVELSKFLQYVSKKTGCHFIYDDKIGQEKVIYEGPYKGLGDIPKDALLKMLNSILKYKGYTTVQEGDQFSILPLQTSKSWPNMIIPPEGEVPASASNIVTKIFKLKYADAEKISRMIDNTQMVNKTWGSIVPITEHGLLIVTDFASNIERIARIIDAIDTSSEDEAINVIQLHNASADDMKKNILPLLQMDVIPSKEPGAAPAGSKYQAKIIADNRTNKLIIIALPDHMEKLLPLIEKLDEKTPEAIGDIHVYVLKNTSAEDLAKKLTEVYSEREEQAGKGTTAEKKQSRMPLEEGELVPRFVADANTNSLIVIASPNTYKELLGILEKLDIRRPQVYIDAAVIEVQNTNGLNFGFELAGLEGGSTDSRRVFGASNFGLSTFTDSDGDGIPDGRFPATVTSGGISLGSGLTAGLFTGEGAEIPLILRALESQTYVNILARPQILTNDNEEATIKSADEFPTGTISRTSDNPDLVSFNDYQEAGITLTIKPHISEADYLRLEIKQDVKSFVGDTQVGENLPPPRTTRSIQASVTIPNRRTVVIGGLIADNQQKTASKVPILGDIPVIGWLFGNRSNNNTKTTLYIFVTPAILRDITLQDLDTLSTEKKAEVKDVGGKWGNAKNDENAR